MIILVICSNPACHCHGKLHRERVIYLAAQHLQLSASGECALYLFPDICKGKSAVWLCPNYVVVLHDMTPSESSGMWRSGQVLMTPYTWQRHLSRRVQAA